VCLFSAHLNCSVLGNLASLYISLYSLGPRKKVGWNGMSNTFLPCFFPPRKEQNNHFFFSLFSASMLKDGHINRLINFPKNSRGLI